MPWDVRAAAFGRHDCRPQPPRARWQRRAAQRRARPPSKLAVPRRFCAAAPCVCRPCLAATPRARALPGRSRCIPHKAHPPRRGRSSARHTSCPVPSCLCGKRGRGPCEPLPRRATCGARHPSSNSSNASHPTAHPRWPSAAAAAPAPLPHTCSSGAPWPSPAGCTRPPPRTCARAAADARQSQAKPPTRHPAARGRGRRRARQRRLWQAGLEARISWRIRHGTSHSSSLARASHAHALLAAAMLKMLLLQPGPTLLSAFRLRRSSSARGPPLMWGGEALVLRRAPADHYCGAAVPCIILAAACGPAPAPLPCSAPQPSALPPKRPPLPPPPRRGRPQRAPPPPPRCPRCCCTRGALPRCAGCACGGTCRGRRRRRWYGAGGHARGVVTGRCDGAEPRVGGLAEAFAEPVCFICGLILGTPTISGRCCRAMAAAAVTTGRGRVQASTRMTSADGSCA